MRLPWLLAGLLIGMACILFSPLAERTLSIMDFIDNQVTEKFVAFEKGQDATLVHEALDLIEAAERNVPVGDTVARKQAIARRLQFFAALDRNIDPQWDANALPVKGATPPLTHGIVYSSGEVDPTTIPDLSVRAKYEQALKTSKDYAKRYDIQLQLRQIDDRAVRFVKLFLSEKYTQSLADQQEFEELLASSCVSAARKKQLRSFMPTSAQDR
jgi:hypothetical protein